MSRVGHARERERAYLQYFNWTDYLLRILSSVDAIASSRVVLIGRHARDPSRATCESSARSSSLARCKSEYRTREGGRFRELWTLRHVRSIFQFRPQRLHVFALRVSLSLFFFVFSFLLAAAGCFALIERYQCVQRAKHVMAVVLSCCMTDRSRSPGYVSGFTHTHAWRDLVWRAGRKEGRPEEEEGSTVSEVNLGCDRGSAGAGASRNRRPRAARGPKEARGPKGRRGSGGNGPRPARASDAPMPPISSS